MTQWGSKLATKTDDPGSIPGTYTMDGEIASDFHTDVVACTHIPPAQ